MNGLTISVDEFEKLPVKKQLKVIFENTEATKESHQRIRFHQKVQYVIISSMLFALGFIANKVF